MSYAKWQKAMRERRRAYKSHRRQVSRDGHIYVVSLGYDDLYKVGKSVRVETRLKDLAASNTRICPILVRRVNKIAEAEAYIHRKLKKVKKWVDREIFRLCSDDIRAIDAMLDRFSPSGATLSE